MLVLVWLACSMGAIAPDQSVKGHIYRYALTKAVSNSGK